MSDEDEVIGCFQLLDPERKGTIKVEELRRIMTNLGDKMTDREVDEMIEDAGGGSKIDYVQFVKKMNQKAARG